MIDQLLNLAVINAIGASVLALLVLVFARFVRDAQTRYWLWLLVLVRLVLPIHVPLTFGLLPRVDSRAAARMDQPIARADSDSRPATRSINEIPLDTSIRHEPVNSITQNNTEGLFGDPGVIDPKADLKIELRKDLGIDLKSVAERNVEPTAVAMSAPTNWKSIVVTVSLCGTVLWSMIALARIMRFHFLVRRTKQAEPQLIELMQRVAKQLSFHRRVDLRVGAGLTPPFVWAIGRPKIVVPARMIDELDEQELNAVLAHELCHLRRRDHWVRWFEMLVLAICWWHPVAWLAARKMREAEDQACDADVVRSMHGIEDSYARGLLKIVDWTSEQVMGTGANGAGHTNLPRIATGLGEEYSFKERIELMLSQTTSIPLARWKRTTLLVAVLMLLPLTVRFVAADQKPEEKAAPDKNENKQSSEDGAKSNADEEAQRLGDLKADMLKKKQTELRKKRAKDIETHLDAICKPRDRGGDGQYSDEWIGAIRDLKEIGEPALWPILERLKGVDLVKNPGDDWIMRKLAFALRAIGNKKAIPALIEIIPKTLIPPGSDMGGMTTKDPELLKFAREHQLDKETSLKYDKGFGFGRPVREVCGAIIELSGADLGEEEIYMIFLEGSDLQVRMKRELFKKVTERRRLWWRQEASRLLGEDYDRMAIATRFPNGPDVSMNESASGAGSRGFGLGSPFDKTPNPPFNVVTSTYDLDAGRYTTKIPTDFFKEELIKGAKTDLEKWNKEFHGKKGTTEPRLQQWIIDQGIDLVGMEIEDGEKKEKYFALYRCGLLAWELDSTNSVENILKQLRAGKLAGIHFGLGRPVTSEFLIHWDEAKKAYDPSKNSSFLFLTREGSIGVLRTENQIRRILTEADLGKADYELPKDAGAHRGIEFRLNFIYDKSKPGAITGEDSLRNAEDLRNNPDPTLTIHGELAPEEKENDAAKKSEIKTLDDIVQQVKKNEALFDNLDVQLIEFYQDISDQFIAGEGEGEGIVLTLGTRSVIHSVTQDRMFRVDCDTTHDDARNQRRTEVTKRVFDLKSTILLQKYSGQKDERYSLYPLCAEDIKIVRPHFMLRRGGFLACPLSVYLQGQQALVNYPNTLWALAEGLEDEVTYRGKDTFNGLKCHVVWINSVNKKTKKPYNRYELWLAEERNFIPVRNVAHTFRESEFAPTSDGVVTTWKELKPGVWFPMRANIQRYASMGPHKLEDKKVSWRQSYSVEKVSLDPKYEKSYFELAIPKGVTVNVTENQRVVRTYVEGESDEKK